MSPVKTTCPYCGVGCGIKALVSDDRAIKVEGDDTHPANAGRLCSKGTHLSETVNLDGRLLYPEIAGERVDWDEALTLVASQFGKAIEKYGPDSVAFYVSGQILTEDYYVANKLMKGFIGSANIDTNSRLCMASAVAAHNRAFGEDVVPTSYSDLEEADLILLVGSNTAWCHPVIWQRIEAAREKNGAKLVVIDPRRTETADCADLHIAIAPDGDVALFNALLAHMAAKKQLDHDYINEHVKTPSDFWDNLSDHNDLGGIDTDIFEQLANLVQDNPKMVTLFSMGANQSTSGTDKGNAIINLHLATGRIAKKGAGPFSITGQPNAMGGREVGGLASTLAVHMGFGEAECQSAQDFWQSPKIARTAGLKAVDMFRAVHDGRIKALWVMGTNPAVSMPDSSFVREALDKCDFLVVSDCISETDTTQFADVKLPALAWGEKTGMVTNSERVMSRQRRLFNSPADAMPDWWAMAQVAQKMGHESAFNYDGPAAIFREFAMQTHFRNNGQRKLDLGQWTGISDAEYEQWQPWQWGGISPYEDNKFTHTDGKARLITVNSAAPLAVDDRFPLILNTGRYRDQWHTMTRTGLSPRLSQHRREALVEIHPNDAKHYDIIDGALARIQTSQGQAIFRAQFSDGQRQGEIYIPMHWTDRFSNQGRANLLPNQSVDPVSNQPGFKRSAASIEPLDTEWRAFLVSTSRPNLPPLLYWSSSRVAGGWLSELSGEGHIDVDNLLPEGERIEAVDMKRGMRRIAVRAPDNRLAAALFLTRNGELPARDWIASQLHNDEQSDGPSLLAGRPKTPMPDKGPIICVCFDVGAKQILNNIADQSLVSVEDIGRALNAGTNCGSCRPALAKLLNEAATKLELSE